MIVSHIFDSLTVWRLTHLFVVVDPGYIVLDVKYVLFLYRTKQNRNFINLYYYLYIVIQQTKTTYKHKVTLYTLTRNTQYIYNPY